MNLKEIAFDAIKRGIDSVLPENCLKESVVIKKDTISINGRKFFFKDFRKIFLIAFGKASVSMAKFFFNKINFSEIIVVGNQQNQNFKFPYIKAGHPIPDENSLKAGKKIYNLVLEATEKDLIIFLLSGGGSAMVEYPKIELEELKIVNRLLLQAGANIHEINSVRKHLSFIKGGMLLKKIRATLISLIISDVIGDSLDTIASGVTYFDNTTYEDSLNVLKKYGIINKVPESVIKIFKNSKDETLKKKEFEKLKVLNVIIANNYRACKEVELFLKGKGFQVFYIGSNLKGEAQLAAKYLSSKIEEFSMNSSNLFALISGGETTVTVKGSGKGGRNQELALSMFPFIKKNKGLFLSIGTDGIDGPTDAAGAYIDEDIVERALMLNLKWKDFLEKNDSYNFFKKTGGLILTGLTGTNVADIQIYII